MAQHVVVAVDSFKGTIGAADAAAALIRGWRSVRPETDVRALPMADGGEGTLDAFLSAVEGSRRMPVTVAGLEEGQIEASWVLLPPELHVPGGTGVVELASTSGVELLGMPPRLRPLDASTRGFGDAIAAALRHGVSRLILGIGSSASTDGGVGALTALGGRFLDSEGCVVPDGGRGVAQIATADLTGLMPPPVGGITVLTDVTNPLLGPNGAAAVFGPQKGASPADSLTLEEGLRRLAGVLDVDPATPGSGAAGGTGFGLLAWGARLAPGSATVADLIGLPNALVGASLVVTGEGSYDGQSAAGKVPAHVRALAASAGVGVAVVAGRVAKDADIHGLGHVVSLTDLAGSAEAAMTDAARLLEVAGAELARAT